MGDRGALGAILFGLAAAGVLACALIRRRLLRAGIAVYVSTLQAAIAVSFTASATPSTGTWTHVGIAELGVWLVWRELAR